MQCRNCGTLFYTPYCHNCGASSNPNKKKDTAFTKWWFWALLFVIICLAVSLYKTNTERLEETSPTTSSNTESTNPSTDNKYRIGEIVNADGLQISLVSAEKWEGYSEWDTPQDGYMYVRVKATFQNNASTDREVEPYSFSCYANDQKQSDFLFATDALSYGMLSPNRKAEGYLYYIVPTNAESIELEYESFAWADQRAIFVLDSIQ